MHPHTPQDRRAYESPEFDAQAPPSDRGIATGRWRSMALSMLFAALLLAANIALAVLL